MTTMVNKAASLVLGVLASMLVPTAFAQAQQVESTVTTTSAPQSPPPLQSLPPQAPPPPQSQLQPPPQSQPPPPKNELDQWLQNTAMPAAAPPNSNTAVIETTTTNITTSPLMRIKPLTVRAPRPRRPLVLTYEQQQQVMLNSVPEAKPPTSPDEIIAFNTMLKQNMPLSPQQVVQLHQQVDTAQRAAATPPVIPPKPVSTTVMVNLAPGTTPPAIRLAQGYVSSLVFVDSTGTPWPISAFDIGSPKTVNLQWDGKGNIILIQAVSPYSNGNIVVRLVGLPTPITLQLVAGQRVVDYRADIHVPGIGPNTKELPMGTPLPDSANQLLLGVLDGVAPAGSKQLTVRGADSQAWLLGDRIYLRTRLTLLSPGWVGKMTSPDGTLAYEIPKTSSVLVSRYGEPAELKIEGL
jgi:intracellular multiplication protein IcmK